MLPSFKTKVTSGKFVNGDSLDEVVSVSVGGANEDGTPKVLVNGDMVDSLGIALSVEGAEEDFDCDDMTYNRTAAASVRVTTGLHTTPQTHSVG